MGYFLITVIFDERCSGAMMDLCVQSGYPRPGITLTQLLVLTLTKLVSFFPPITY